MNQTSGTSGSSEQGVLITVQEVATRLQLKESWVYNHADQLGAYRLGKYVRFSWPRVLERLDASAEN